MGLIGGPKETEVKERGSLAEAVRVLGSEMGQIRGILNVGLAEVVKAMSQ